MALFTSSRGLDWTPTRQVSAQEIEAAKTPKGGWTREQMDAWGVPHPPPKGWKKRLIKGGPDEGQMIRQRLDRLYDEHEEARFDFEQGRRHGAANVLALAARDAQIVAAITAENARLRRLVRGRRSEKPCRESH